jgi:hypothetical protein
MAPRAVSIALSVAARASAIPRRNHMYSRSNVRAVAIAGVLSVTPALIAAPDTDVKQDGNAADGLTMTLTDGTTQFVLNGIEGERLTSSGGLADLVTGVGSDDTDHMFQNWFWYRTPGDSREYALSNRVMGGGGGGNSNRLVYIEPANDGQIDNALLVEIEYTLTDLSTAGGDRALLQIGFRLRNLTDSNLNVQFYAYNDFDLGGSLSNEIASIVGSDDNGQVVTDIATGDRANFNVSGTNQFRWGIEDFAGLRNLLTDGVTDDLPNASSPFGPDDYTGAHQWGVTLAPESQPVQSTLVGSIVIDIQRQTCASDIAPPGGDGEVNVSDLLRLLAEWGACP